MTLRRKEIGKKNQKGIDIKVIQIFIVSGNT